MTLIDKIAYANEIRLHDLAIDLDYFIITEAYRKNNFERADCYRVHAGEMASIKGFLIEMRDLGKPYPYEAWWRKQKLSYIISQFKWNRIMARQRKLALRKLGN